MLGLRVEHRPLSRPHIARDIAEHIRTSSIWSAAIVAEHPAQMHAAIRKELQRIAQADSAVLSNAATPVHFSADALDQSLDTHVIVATADEFLTAPPMHRVMYVACSLDQITLRRITSFMPPQSLVVLYDAVADI